MYWLAIIGALLVFFIFGFDVGVYALVGFLLVAVFSNRRKRKEKHSRSEGFGRINKFDEERVLGADEYQRIINPLTDLIGRAETLVSNCRDGSAPSGGRLKEAMINTADDLRWNIENIDDYRLTIRRKKDRDSYRSMMVTARQYAAILHAAAEEDRSPAEFDTRIVPLKGRFQMDYENAHGEKSRWDIAALGLSTIGENRYLWLYSDKVKGVRQFRLDRIISIKDAKSGETAEGGDVANWLAARAGPKA